jgi:monovalent cation:H+ antiporter, CPA1 family
MAKLKTLRRCKLFEALDYRDLSILAAHVREESSAPNQWIAQEGGASSGLIILKSGKAELTSALTGRNSVAVGPGDFFGELSFVNGSSHRAVGAKSLEKCEYLRIEASAYRKLMEEAPQVAGKVAQSVLEAMNDKVTMAMNAFGKVLRERKGTNNG